MKMLLMHTPSPMGPAKQIAVNSDEILRMEEVEGGMTQIIQQDKGPTTVEESLEDILKTMGEVKEVKSSKPKPGHEPPEAHGGQMGPQPGQPIGQAHQKAGGTR